MLWIVVHLQQANVEAMKLDKAFEFKYCWILLRKKFQIAMLGAEFVQRLIPNNKMEQNESLFPDNSFHNRF